MNSIDYRVTALLTEHLGFAPLTLVDEVINAVNKIMTNCVDALETFLLRRRDAQVDELWAQHGLQRDSSNKKTIEIIEKLIAKSEREGTVFPLDEVRNGTVQLETLLASHVDENFDKFELYTLRNILTLPRDLVEEGYIRLKHHEHLDVETLDTDSHADPQASVRIETLLQDIGRELQLRQILQLHLTHAQKLVSVLTRYKSSVRTLLSTQSDSALSPETARMLKESLTPMSENVYYLLSQSKELMDQTQNLSRALSEGAAGDSGEADAGFHPSNRERYLSEKTSALLHHINTLKRVH